MTENYATYLLKENPFPQVATVDPSKTDIRVNGTIFREEVLCDEVRALTDKIDKKTAMIYVAGLKFDKGIGKSALIFALAPYPLSEGGNCSGFLGSYSSALLHGSRFNLFDIGRFASAILFVYSVD